MEIPLGNRKLNITCGNKNQVELKKRKYNWNLNFVEYLLAADFENRIKNDLKDRSDDISYKQKKKMESTRYKLEDPEISNKESNNLTYVW